MRAGESFKWLNLAAGTYDLSNVSNTQNKAGVAGKGFVLQGGDYFLDLLCTGSPTLALNILGPDGATWTLVLPTAANVGTAGTPAAVAAAGVYRYFSLPPGVYEIVVATSTANYVSLTRIPEAE